MIFLNQVEWFMVPPKKKTSYQARLKQQNIEALTYQKATNGQKNTHQTINKTSSGGVVSCFLLICIIIGAGVVIGIAVSENASNNNNNITTLPTHTSNTNPTTTSSVSTYALTGSVTTIHGTTIQLSNFQGKTLILYFTGASCIPCKAQLPYLVAAYNQYKSTNKAEVISLDIQGQTVSALLSWESENGITWNVCQDTGYTLSTRFSVYSMPTLVILNKNGNEINRYVGAQSQETINAIFQSVVAS